MASKLRQELGQLMPLAMALSEDQISDMPLRCSPPRSPARKSLSACMTSCPMPRRSQPSLERHAGRIGADRADDLCDARRPQEDRDRRRRRTIKAIGLRRARRLSRAGQKCISFVVKVREKWGDIRTLPEMDWIFRRVIGGAVSLNSAYDLSRHPDELTE